jgi:hypothetical protein
MDGWMDSTSGISKGKLYGMVWYGMVQVNMVQLVISWDEMRPDVMSEMDEWSRALALVLD